MTLRAGVMDAENPALHQRKKKKKKIFKGTFILNCIDISKRYCLFTAIIINVMQFR